MPPTVAEGDQMLVGLLAIAFAGTELEDLSEEDILKGLGPARTNEVTKGEDNKWEATSIEAIASHPRMVGNVRSCFREELKAIPSEQSAMLVAKVRADEETGRLTFFMFSTSSDVESDAGAQCLGTQLFQYRLVGDGNRGMLTLTVPLRTTQ